MIIGSSIQKQKNIEILVLDARDGLMWIYDIHICLFIISIVFLYIQLYI